LGLIPGSFLLKMVGNTYESEMAAHEDKLIYFQMVIAKHVHSPTCDSSES